MNSIYAFSITVFIFNLALNNLFLFQQSRYNLKRFFGIFNAYALYLKANVLVLILSVILELLKVNKLIISIIYLIFGIYFIYQELRVKRIKPLVFTFRVIRQVVVYVLLHLFISILLLQFIPISLVAIISYALTILCLTLTAYITAPFEFLVRERFKSKAKKVLAKHQDLIKIGITGSFGKTSTKNIINDIISEDYYTLITPASFNTPMGITRVILNDLKPIHQVFVCEMGAEKKGDISELMKFVRPFVGVVTSIGPQHLQTFINQENITSEKMKIVEMLDEKGVAIINLDNEHIASYQIKNKCQVISVGIENQKADYVAKNISYSKEGVSFDVLIDNTNYHFESILLGKYNIINILVGIALARWLNIDILKIVKNVKNIKRIKNRLELKTINGFTFIDNAFNSNPVSSKMSVDVLNYMPGMKVVITPGLIDLGKSQDRYNFEFGEYMADKVDFVILVGRQTKTIEEGLLCKNFSKDKIVVVESTSQAFNYVRQNFQTTDTILIENDLPDTFLK